ncbi:MAG TPA: transglycosylase SLT domain-containing protein [Gemmatimonadaceae bacterium]|nr:transglycosylase SLT domain-containing protein [Gemmatimonadaceae bacterium]
MPSIPQPAASQATAADRGAQPATMPDSTPRDSSTNSVAVMQQAAPVASSSSSHSSTLPVPATTSTSAPASTPLAAADVERRAAEVFGESPASRPTRTDSAEAPSWDIDVRSYESTDRVAHYVQLFTGPAKERITARLERGTRYETMIRSMLRAGGLPEDMYYLALVESGFDPNAYSRAAAVGMWQFMTSTGRDMGLRVDWWVDERRDPVKSTLAAVRFIKGLQDQFGSLYLAAAAYNGGPGRISRGLTRYAQDLDGTSGDDLFFALADKDYLKNETRDYVPQLIAAALIAKEPARYGMSVATQAPFAYDSVRVGPFTTLSAVARAANASIPQLQELNPQFLRGVTPPRDSSLVRVPLGAGETFASAFAALPSSDRAALRTVVSKKGESSASIAKRAGITSRQLSFYNPKLRTLKSGTLAAGQSLLVPTGAAVAGAEVVPDPAIERYPTTHVANVHVVKPGETLSAIAKRYHTSTVLLMRTNHLRRALIFPGQSLVVRASH